MTEKPRSLEVLAETATARLTSSWRVIRHEESYRGTDGSEGNWLEIIRPLSECLLSLRDYDEIGQIAYDQAPDDNPIYFPLQQHIDEDTKEVMPALIMVGNNNNFEVMLAVADRAEALLQEASTS